MNFNNEELQRSNRTVQLKEPNKQPQLVEGHLNPDEKTWEIYDHGTSTWKTVPKEYIDVNLSRETPMCFVPVSNLQPPPSMSQYMAYHMTTDANHVPCVIVGFGLTPTKAIQHVQNEYQLKHACPPTEQNESLTEFESSHLVKIVDLAMTSNFTIGGQRHV